VSLDSTAGLAPALNYQAHAHASAWTPRSVAMEC
jgi:hypothetical protein